MKRFAIFLLLSVLALPVAAQDYKVPEIEISKDKVLVDGKPFFAHVVTPKQTLFSISKAYGVSVRDIIDANRKLDLENRGLKIGDVLLIPDVLSIPKEPADVVQDVPEEAMAEPDMAAVPSHMKTAEDVAYMHEAAQADTLIDQRALFPGMPGYRHDTDPQHYADSVFYMNQVPERISVAVLLPFDASGKAASEKVIYYTDGGFRIFFEDGPDLIKVKITDVADGSVVADGEWENGEAITFDESRDLNVEVTATWDERAGRDSFGEVSYSFGVGVSAG